MNYVSYLRVSTARQGESKLGLEAQRHAVKTTFGGVIREFLEVESGKNDKRPELMRALRICKENGYMLVIAKLDRLSRKLSFISSLMDSGVQFKCADMPDINNFTIHILAAVAQNERET